MSSRLSPTRLERLLGTLAAACSRKSWVVVICWLALTALAAAGTSLLPTRLLSGSGDIAGSASARVDGALRANFPALENQSLLLVLRSASLDHDTPAQRVLLESLARRLASVNGVEAVQGLPTSNLAHRPARGQLLIVRLNTAGGLASEQVVPHLRTAAAPVFEHARIEHPDLEWAVTGRAALTYDLNDFSQRDSFRAELRALPLTFIVLLAAFGTFMAALLPLILAIVTRTVALGSVFIVAGTLDVSNQVVGIVTMLAIALGIDYSLFFVQRFRQSGAGTALLEAARTAGMEAGPAILFSALAVAIGMAGLLLTPLMQTRSIGLGGIGAVVISLTAALTLLPALLALLPPRWVRLPASAGDGSRTRWRNWGTKVLRHPKASIALSLLVLLILAAPALHTRFGFPEEEALPRELEYRRGLEMLSAMGLRGLASPITIIVTDEVGEPVVKPERIGALDKFVDALDADHTSQVVVAPDFVAAARPLPFPVPQNAALISADESRLAVQVLPESDASLADLRAFADRAGRALQLDGVAVDVGGQAQYYNDFDRSVRASYPVVLGSVLSLSAISLLLLFRAPLIAFKALVLNLLSVAAGFGVVVLVFQFGHGANLIGLESAPSAIPATVPLVIFAVLFGVSMDYEIFLLTRIRAAFVLSGDPAGSIVEGLADTGSVITSAALVMVSVFGAFAFADMIIVQMVGLGLAVAVAVDALLIRSALGPALMQIAGRWNWWPA